MLLVCIHTCYEHVGKKNSQQPVNVGEPTETIRFSQKFRPGEEYSRTTKVKKDVKAPQTNVTNQEVWRSANRWGA
jgi:hypothetical protein